MGNDLPFPSTLLEPTLSGQLCLSFLYAQHIQENRTVPWVVCGKDATTVGGEEGLAVTVGNSLNSRPSCN